MSVLAFKVPYTGFINFVWDLNTGFSPIIQSRDTQSGRGFWISLPSSRLQMIERNGVLERVYRVYLEASMVAYYIVILVL